MSTKPKLKEGIGGFIRGVASNVGQRIGQSAPARAAKDIYRSGQQESAVDDITSSMQKFYRIALLYQQIRSTAAQRRPSAPAAAEPSHQSQLQRPSDATPSAFRTTDKPRGTTNDRGDFAYTFNSYLVDVVGQRLDEGAWDFVRGASRAVGQSVGNKINAYAQRNRGFLNDVVSAGRTASQEAEVRKAGEKVGALRKAASASLAALASAYSRLPAGVRDDALKAAAEKIVKPNHVQWMINIVKASGQAQ